MTTFTATPGILSDEPPPPHAASYADALCRDVSQGRFDRALDELTAADWEHIEDRPLLVKVREAVAAEYARQAAEPFEKLVSMAVHALGISSYTCESIIEDNEGQLHLVSETVCFPEELGDEVHTACGLTLWSEYADPLVPAMRGSWQNPERYEVAVCRGCAVHANSFPETREDPEAATMPTTLGAQFSNAARDQTQQDLNDDMGDLCRQDPVAVLRIADDKFKERLSRALAQGAVDGGDELLKTVIRKYYDYDKAAEKLAACGYDGSVASLVTFDEWSAAAGNTLEDLLEEDSGAVAASYLYSELRSLLGEKIRLMQLQAQAVSAAPGTPAPLAPPTKHLPQVRSP